MQTVIFRPTNSCNLRCSYCYDKNNHSLPEQQIRQNATKLFEREEEQLLRSLDMIYQGEKKPKIIFHGGEPLLISPEVLNRFCHRLKDQQDIRFSIQTNGTLINDEVIDLFKEHNFSVGISLDGCNEQQNHARVFPNGINSFQPVIKNIAKLQDANVKFGIIMSITNAHQNSEQQLYDFIANNGLSCNIRPVFASDSATAQTVMTEEEYAKFFSKLFDIWYDDEEKKVGTHQILEIYQALKKELSPSYIDRNCSNSAHCFRDFISLDVLSNLYACNRLYGIDKFYYGNLKTTTMKEVYQKVDKLITERQQAIATTCSGCETLKECNGGCPAEAYDIYGDIKHPTTACKVKKLVSDHVRGRLECQ